MLKPPALQVYGAKGSWAGRGSPGSSCAGEEAATTASSRTRLRLRGSALRTQRAGGSRSYGSIACSSPRHRRPSDARGPTTCAHLPRHALEERLQAVNRRRAHLRRCRGARAAACACGLQPSAPRCPLQATAAPAPPGLEPDAVPCAGGVQQGARARGRSRAERTPRIQLDADPRRGGPEAQRQQLPRADDQQWPPLVQDGWVWAEPGANSDADATLCSLVAQVNRAAGKDVALAFMRDGHATTECPTRGPSATRSRSGRF